MQQNSVEILCTRALPDWLVEEAALAGIAIDVQPFIDTEPIQTIEVQQEIEHTLLQAAVVVFTSINAVEAVAAGLDGQQPQWSIYCIGAATQKKVAAHFGQQAIVGVANDAAALAALMVEDGLADEVIFFCGAQRRDELPGILKDAGIEVDEIVVYQTIELPHVLRKVYQGILFFSPSAVRAYFAKNKPQDTAIIFAIGNTTASEVKKYASNKVLISDEPGKESLVQKVVEYFSP